MVYHALGGLPMSAPTLTPAQQTVADEMLRFGAGQSPHAVATLAGYAGVGKTTVVAHVVQALARDGIAIAVLAPTHKALSVIGDKLGDTTVEAMTLHAALALRVTERPDGLQELTDSGDSGDLRNFDLAVIDEASMVSPGLFASALSKRGRCRLLFVGDQAQLPPVDQNRASSRDPGAITLSPVFGSHVPLHWRLLEVVRQAQDNPIIRLATAARRCIDAGEDFGLDTMAGQLHPGDDAFLDIRPGGVAEVSRLVADAIAHGQDTRALAFDNNTVQAINASVHTLVHMGQGDYPPDTLLIAQDGFNAFAPGTEGLPSPKRMPVRNSALLTVVGSVESPHPSEAGRPAYKLTLCTDEGARLVCWVPADQRQWQADISEHFAEYRRLKLRLQIAVAGERRAIEHAMKAASQQGWTLKARFASLRYAYAMTVHKSQGSTFDAAVLDWTSFQRCRDTQQRNRLAYVALTRSRRFAVVCA